MSGKNITNESDYVYIKGVPKKWCNIVSTTKNIAPFFGTTCIFPRFAWIPTMWVTVSINVVMVTASASLVKLRCNLKTR